MLQWVDEPLLMQVDAFLFKTPCLLDPAAFEAVCSGYFAAE
jgi:hypothetical protein